MLRRIIIIIILLLLCILPLFVDADDSNTEKARSPISEIFLNSGENEVGSNSVVSSSNGHHIFLATETAPSIVVKIDAKTRTRVGALTLGPGDINAGAGHDDSTASAVAWWVMNGGLLVQVDTDKMIKTRSVSLLSGANKMLVVGTPSALTGHFAWLFAAVQLFDHSSSSRSFVVVMIEKSTLSVSDTSSGNNNNNNFVLPSAAKALHAQGTFLYAACDSATASDGVSYLVKFKLGSDGSVSKVEVMRLSDRPTAICSTIGALVLLTATSLLKISLAQDNFAVAGRVPLGGKSTGRELLLFDGKQNFYIASSNPSSLTHVQLQYGANGGESLVLRRDSLPLPIDGAVGGVTHKNELFLAFAGAPGRLLVVETDDDGNLPEDAALVASEKRKMEIDVGILILLLILLGVLISVIYKKCGGAQQGRREAQSSSSSSSSSAPLPCELWSPRFLNAPEVGVILDGDVVAEKKNQLVWTARENISFSNAITDPSHPLLQWVQRWVRPIDPRVAALNNLATRRVTKAVFVRPNDDQVQRFLSLHRSEGRARAQSERLRVPPPRDADSVAALDKLKACFVDATAGSAAIHVPSSSSSSSSSSSHDAFSRILYAWHGCPLSAVESVLRYGPRNLRTTDAGFFGSGSYFSLEMEYAAPYSTPAGDVAEKEAALILFAISVSQVYPVTLSQDYKLVEGDDTPSRQQGFSRFYGETHKAISLMPNYDAHFVPVKYYGSKHPRSGKTVSHNVDFQAASENDPDLAAHEIVIGAHSRCLPVAVVYFAI